MKNNFLCEFLARSIDAMSKFNIILFYLVLVIQIQQNITLILKGSFLMTSFLLSDDKNFVMTMIIYLSFLCSLKGGHQKATF